MPQGDKMKPRTLIITCMSVIWLAACSSTQTTPQPLALDNVRTILPTVPAANVSNLAQLADEATLQLGNELYDANCAACHGINGEGQFPDAPMQPDDTGRIGAPPHNGDGHTWHHDDYLLFEIVHDGGMGLEGFYPMPAFGDQLSDDEIVAVLEYIKTMWTPQQRMIQAERTLLASTQQD